MNSTLQDREAIMQSAAAGVSGILTAPINPRAIPRFIRGISTVSKNAIIGRLFTSPRTRTFLTGLGDKPLDLTALRALSAISAEMAADVQEDLKQLRK